jgi:hypothetical protein
MMAAALLLLMHVLLLLHLTSATSWSDALFGSRSGCAKRGRSGGEEAVGGSVEGGIFSALFGPSKSSRRNHGPQSGTDSDSGGSSVGGKDPIAAKVQRIRQSKAQGSGRHRNGRSRSDLDLKVAYLYNDDHLQDSIDYQCCEDECCACYNVEQVGRIRAETYGWSPNVERSEMVCHFTSSYL